MVNQLLLFSKQNMLFSIPSLLSKCTLFSAYMLLSTHMLLSTMMLFSSSPIQEESSLLSDPPFGTCSLFSTNETLVDPFGEAVSHLELLSSISTMCTFGLVSLLAVFWLPALFSELLTKSSIKASAETNHPPQDCLPVSPPSYRSTRSAGLYALRAKFNPFSRSYLNFDHKRSIDRAHRRNVDLFVTISLFLLWLPISALLLCLFPYLTETLLIAVAIHLLSRMAHRANNNNRGGGGYGPPRSGIWLRINQHKLIAGYGRATPYGYTARTFSFSGGGNNGLGHNGNAPQAKKPKSGSLEGSLCTSPVVCPVVGCETRCSAIKALIAHLNTHQSDSCLSGIARQTPNGYSCEFANCRKTFYTRTALMIHLAVHAQKAAEVAKPKTAVSRKRPPNSSSSKCALGAELLRTSGMEAWLFDTTISAISTNLLEGNDLLAYICPTYWVSFYRKQMMPPRMLYGTSDWKIALVPVFGNSPHHWSLAVLDREQCMCIFYDSFHRTASPDTIAGLNHIWSCLLPDEILPTVLAGNHSAIDRQADCFSCGIYVCRIIELLSKNPTNYNLIAIRATELPIIRESYAKMLGLIEAPKQPVKPKRRRTVNSTGKPAKPTVAPKAPLPTVEATDLYPNEASNPTVDQINQWHKTDRQWSDFETICANFLVAKQQPVVAAAPAASTCEKGTQTMRCKPRVELVKTHEYDRSEASTIQKLYRKCRKAAISRILGDQSSRCRISIESVRDHFAKIMSPADIDEQAMLRNAPRCEQIDEQCAMQLCAPISAKEVLSTLGRMSNTAPGSDQLQYRDLRKLDPSGVTLAAIYSTCLSQARIPSAWKNSSTVLLYKKGEPNDITNWRPISIMLTVYKLYTSILSRRLSKSISDRKLLDSPDLITSHEQLGFEQTEGCTEHIFELQSCLSHARQSGSNLFVCFLDLSNAFGSVPHSLIQLMLQRIGFGTRFCDIVDDMYRDATMTVKSNGLESSPIPICAGVKQGDPLSPTLFCVALEYIIRNLKKKLPGSGYQWCPGHSTFLLAYADDLALVCKSADELSKSLAELSRLADICGLSFKPAKCATLSVCGGQAIDRQFEIQRTKMPALNKGQFYLYLGAPIGLGISTAAVFSNLFTKARNDLQLISGSALAAFQKLDAIKTFIVPRFYYHFAHSRPLRGDLDSFDVLLQKSARTTLGLPHFSVKDYLHLPSSLGGVGLLPLTALEAIICLSHSFRLLTSKRAITRRLAIAALKREVATVVRRVPTDVDVENFLNCRLPMKGDNSRINCSQFLRMVKATDYLKNIQPQFSFKDDSLCLTVSGTVTIAQSNRNAVQRHLRHALGLVIQRQLLEHPIQGHAFPLILKDKANYQFIRDAKHISFGAFRFIHKARLQLLPLNMNSHKGTKQCRNCGYAFESLSHVLNHCFKRNSKRITDRHNSVQQLLIDTVKKHAKVPLQISTNRVCTFTGERLIPDVMIRSPSEKKIFIIDITCPSETSIDTFDKARLTKIQKYKGIHDHYTKLGYTVVLDAFIVGSLGSYDPLNNDLLRELGLPHRASRTMIRKMVGSVIEQSKDIYWAHILGDKFEKPSLRGGYTSSSDPRTSRLILLGDEGLLPLLPSFEQTVHLAQARIVKHLTFEKVPVELEALDYSPRCRLLVATLGFCEIYRGKSGADLTRNVKRGVEALLRATHNVIDNVLIIVPPTSLSFAQDSNRVSAALELKSAVDEAITEVQGEITSDQNARIDPDQVDPPKSAFRHDYDERVACECVTLCDVFARSGLLEHYLADNSRLNTSASVYLLFLLCEYWATKYPGVTLDMLKNAKFG